MSITIGVYYFWMGNTGSGTGIIGWAGASRAGTVGGGARGGMRRCRWPSTLVVFLIPHHHRSLAWTAAREGDSFLLGWTIRGASVVRFAALLACFFLFSLVVITDTPPLQVLEVLEWNSKAWQTFWTQVTVSIFSSSSSFTPHARRTTAVKAETRQMFSRTRGQAEFHRISRLQSLCVR